MRKFFCFIWLVCLTFSVGAQEVLSLDSCRALAIANNKELLISQEKINSAHYQRKAAFTNYLPDISATGGYMRTQKEISLLSDAQKGALGSMGTQVSGAMQNGIQGILTQHPELTQNPQFMALIQALGSVDVASPLNGLGNSLVDAFRTDTRNMYAGALTLTQPLYMGGKIRAYNKITKYAEELARQQHDSGLQDVILSTDQAYWQVVSLASKKKLAEGYLKLLQKLESDVDKMIAEGVATKADGLSVKVRVNEAEMTLTKVEDGLSLSRMLLCQLCGLDLSSPITLKDEREDDLSPDPVAANGIDLNTVYATRPEVRSLELATEIYKSCRPGRCPPGQAAWWGYGPTARPAAATRRQSPPRRRRRRHPASPRRRNGQNRCPVSGGTGTPRPPAFWHPRPGAAGTTSIPARRHGGCSAPIRHKGQMHFHPPPVPSGAPAAHAAAAARRRAPAHRRRYTPCRSRCSVGR